MRKVTRVSNSIIEAFKMLFDIEVTPGQNKRALKGLKEFRSKHWDAKVPKDEAYAKYVNQY